MNNVKALLMVLSSVAAGTLLGILFAPDKGTSTRRNITNKSKDYMNGLGSNFDNMVADMLHKIKPVKKAANGIPTAKI